NVPTVVWIDERGRIVRPQDVAFGSDKFRHLTGIESAKHVGLLRAWVRGELAAPADDRARERLSLPPEADQPARAAVRLGPWLWSQGRGEAAASHFVRAGELAPHDFTIRRGTMPMRGLDPMGPVFRQMRDDWAARGERYYKPLPD